MTLRARLETALKSQAAIDAGLSYTDSQDTKIRTGRGLGERTFPVYLEWGGRTRAGTSQFHRTVWRVVVLVAPMQTADPWSRVDEAVDAVIEVVHAQPNTFAELLPVLPGEVAPQGDARRGGDKTFAAAIVQVVDA